MFDIKKSYKIKSGSLHKSHIIQLKLFSYGCKWANDMSSDPKPLNLSNVYLLIDKGIISYASSVTDYRSSEFIELTFDSHTETIKFPPVQPEYSDSKTKVVIVPKEEFKQEKEKVEVEVKTPWKLTLSDLSEIDVGEIFSSLTRTNPIALVNFGNGQGRVFIHPSIYVKANKLNIRQPLVWNAILDVSHFKDAVEWVKKVRETPWHSKEKLNVTINFPTID